MLPREIALQVKSGSSYISKSACKIPATSAQIAFWAEHDLVTLGVVYDPAEIAGYWVDLQTESRLFRRREGNKSGTFSFSKSPWNRFDNIRFADFLIPNLIGEVSNVPLAELIKWLASNDLETHDIAVRAICRRYYHDALAWQVLIEAFKQRPVERLTFSLAVSLSMLLGHDDIGFYDGKIPTAVRLPAIDSVLQFEADEIAKVLGLVQDGDFDRPSEGYSLLPLLGCKAESLKILEHIRDGDKFSPIVREYASMLADWHHHEPDWWKFWRRDVKI